MRNFKTVFQGFALMLVLVFALLAGGRYDATMPAYWGEDCTYTSYADCKEANDGRA